MLLIFTILILITANTIYTQPDTLWTKTFGGSNYDIGFSVQQTLDSGFIITGATSSYGTGSDDVWLIKTDENGDEQWSKTFGGNDGDYGNSVQQTTDGGYILLADSGSWNYSDIWLIKCNSIGDTIWTKTFGSSGRDEGRYVRQTLDGGYIISGMNGENEDAAWLIKTDSFGNEEWSNTYSNYWSSFQCVQQTSDEGFIAVGFYGYETDTEEIIDIMVVKTDINGNIEWNNNFGGEDKDLGYFIQQTNDGGFIVVGRTKSFGAGYFDVFLVKIDIDGNEEWNRTFGGSEWDEGISVQQTTSGGYIIVGTTESFGNGEGDVWVIKTDANGDTAWAKTLGGTNYDEGVSVRQTVDGGYIIAGRTESYGSGSSDVWLIRLVQDSVEVSIESTNEFLPSSFLLYQNYPNPFNPITTIDYQISKTSFVKLSIYDISGRIVETIENEHKNAGYYSVEWNASGVSSGLYFYRIEAGGYNETKKCLILK